MEDRNEKKIEEALLKGTEEALALKDSVWKNIEGRIEFNKGKVEVMKQKRKGYMKYAGIAAALAIMVLANTQYGNAAVDEIRKLFAPKKTVEQQLEGNGEKTEMGLKTSPMKYIIYIDEAMYKMENLQGKDVIKPINPAADRPEVSMTIEQIVDRSPEAVAAEIENQLKTEFKTVQNNGKVTDPISSIYIRAKSGNDINSKVVNYYIIDNTKGGSFIIKTQYFFEAAEGHGARFYHMIKEFKIVNE